MTREKIPNDEYPQKPACMILCAGTSRRFGSNKMLAPLAGKPLLAHTIDRVRPQVSKLALNGDGHDYDRFDLPVFPDVITGKLGPLAGILTAMEWAGGLGDGRVLTVSGDTPFVPDCLAARLAQASKDTIALSYVEGRSHQICGLWPTALAQDLRSVLQAGDSYRVRDFLQRHKTVNIEFPKQNGIEPFFNVNTPEDMAKAEQILAARNGHVSGGA